MLKKFFVFLFIFLVFPIFGNASMGSVVKIGNKYYETLEEAIANAKSTDTITLVSDVKLEETLNINKIVNIDLNGKNISAPSKVFLVENGTLNIDGTGNVKENEPNYGAVMVVGSLDKSANDYSVVNIGEDVTLEGWSGIFINRNYSSAYGVEINFSGKINSVNDTAGGEGIGIYVNGNIKHKDNAPVVNIKDGAEIVSTGNGLYIAGYSTFNIDEAYISGKESGIGIKSGVLNIDGATVVSDGEDKTPTEGYQNGIKASGTALQIESNNGYAGNMKINISGGEFKSKNSNTIYEYIGRGTETQIKEISISGGKFLSNNKDVFRISDSLKNAHNNFISGGIYSTDPSEYLNVGYTSVFDNNMYKVVKSTMKEVNGFGSYSNNFGIGKTIIISLIVIVLSFLGYINRKKILNLFK